ncbi:hypothetical protein CF327_g617 [Tilletia walkeri]|nr:hypothetical protein CF327_g617 [Tilletia walkeri]
MTLVRIAGAALERSAGARVTFRSVRRCSQSHLDRRAVIAQAPSRNSSSKASTPSPKEVHTHQTLARQYGLFFTHESSPGTPFFQPNGWRIVQKLLRVVRDLYDRQGYDEVCSPQIYSEALWKTSGHWDNYRSEMFGVEGYRERDLRETAGASAYGTSCPAHAYEHGHEGAAEHSHDGSGLKPMNCPGHCLMFAHEERSYRDLPIRYAEFSPLHRNEPSGSLSGLTRVRRFHQDDAHVFCAPEQVSTEILTMLGMLRSAYETFGFPSSALELVLSTRPDKSIGSADEWTKAEDALRAALDASHLAWSPNEGDGAFYGPKIDVRLLDALGRKHQTATIQLDFQLPRRFELHFKNEAGEPERPVMIHRAILGSAERFMAILLEAGQGEWPFWLSPRQAIVIPVGRNPAVKEYAQRVRQALALGDALNLTVPLSQDSTQESTTSTSADAAEVEQNTAKLAQELLRRSGRTLQHFHVEVDSTAERLDKRVRRAEVGRINFVLVVGEKEMENGTVNVRARSREDSATVDDGAAASQTIEEGRPGWEKVVKKDMGEWKVEKLRDLFCYLDSHHL